MATLDSPAVTQIDSEVRTGLYTANSLLAANTANVPAALTVAEQTLVGRVTGGSIGALTQAQSLAVVGAVDGYHHLAGGEGTMLRALVSSGAAAMVTNYLRVTTFRARKTEVVTQVRVITGTTAAAATPSLCRIGIYSVDGSGNMALVGSIANDTSLFAAANTSYTRSLSASFTKTAGSVYALGVLVVTATTPPTLCGIVSPLGAAEMGASPRMGGFVTGQADLPASISAGSITDSHTIAYGVLLP